MQPHRLLRVLPLLLVIAACGEDQSPTTPTPPAAPGSLVSSHTAGHTLVNSLADPGDGHCDAAQCTLREAINDPGSTEISFAPGLTGSITLANPGVGGGTLAIEKTLTITGPSPGIVIQRRITDPAFGILHIGAGVSVRLSNLTVRDGKANADGGGIINFGTLALTNTTIADNTAGGGGGIDNHGTLTLMSSTISRDSAILGGGIANRDGGTLRLVNSLVAGNSADRGGGIITFGVLSLTNSTVAGNAAMRGGGIEALGGRSTLANARIVGNSANIEGGGVQAARAVSFVLTNSLVARNSAASGGGIANRDGGAVTIIKSTIARNSATLDGGGIFNTVAAALAFSATLTVKNSTVSGNSANRGGGIFNEGRIGVASVTLGYSTVARNSAILDGGGIFNEASPAVIAGATLAVKNSLVARNLAGGGGPDLLNSAGSMVGARFSLIGDGTDSGVTNSDGNQVGNVGPNSSPIDPRIGPLAANGGRTRTHALLPKSPAINAASTRDCPATDQRGVPRPQGAACDIGSYERRRAGT